MERQTGAIVVGGYANGVGVVHSLARQGIPVDVVLTMPQDIAQYSRFVRRHYWLLELEERPESLIELLERHAEQWRGWVILPTNDPALSVLAQHHARLAERFRLTFPPWEVTRRVLDKRITAAYAREVGIDVPRAYGQLGKSPPNTGQIEYPALVKPVQSHLFTREFGKKVFLVRNAVELDAAVDRVRRAGIECELIELVPGPEELIQHFQVYIDASGHPHGEFTLRKLRQSPPYFGVARACERFDAPELREPSLALLCHLGWRGIASVAYKASERTGRRYLMEINGRIPLSHGLARRSGIDYALMAFNEALTGKIRGLEPNDWYGVWVHLHADLLYTAMFFRQEKLDWRKFFASYRRPKTFAVWARDDPKPFFAQWCTTIRKGLRTISDRGQRQEVFGRVQSMASTGTTNKETGSGAIGGRDSRGPSGTTHLTGDTDSEHRSRAWR